MNIQVFKEARTENKLFTAFPPWQQWSISSGFGETSSQDFLSSVSHMINIWKSFGLEEVKTQGVGLIQFPKKAMERLSWT